MITTIIFDIGNVLADFAWENYLDGFGFSEDVKKRISEAMMLSPEWNDFDRGTKSDEELVESFVRNAPELEKQIRSLCVNIHGMVVKQDYAIPWISKLKEKGYRVYYLSNFSRKAAEECADALSFIPYTDGGILSYREKTIKPERRIYELLISRYHLNPSECVFLDDRKNNCETAEQLGMKTICFTTKEAAVRELKKLGVD